MNEREIRDALERAYGETPQAFHGRVRDTLLDIRRGEREPVMKRKLGWGAALVLALLLASTAAVAANLTGVLGFITNTASKTWVLDEASDIVHLDAASASVGNCTAKISEWACDGEVLVVTLNVVDPALATEGYYVPEDEDEDYLAGLENYGLTHMPGALRVSAGEIGGKSLDFYWGDEEACEIIYAFEAPLQNAPDAFTVTVPFSCSAGEGELSFDVTSADFGRVREFALPEPSAFDGYALAVTKCKGTALYTYMAMELTFDEATPQARREEIAEAYMEGMVAPQGVMDTVAGEGEEIALPRRSRWSQDERAVFIELLGNPRQTYPQTAAFYPRWGMDDVDLDAEKVVYPPLSQEGAVIFDLRAR